MISANCKYVAMSLAVYHRVLFRSHSDCGFDCRGCLNGDFDTDRFYASFNGHAHHPLSFRDVSSHCHIFAVIKEHQFSTLDGISEVTLGKAVRLAETLCCEVSDLYEIEVQR